VTKSEALLVANDAVSYVCYRASYELPDEPDEDDSEWSAKRIGG
jgi:hypothetical protein